MVNWYKKQLNSPKWNTKRKKILKRDKYKCTICKGKKNLEVHHTFYYDKFINPWNYPNKSLITLCNKCHSELHERFSVEIKSYQQTIKKKSHLKRSLKKKKKGRSLIKIQSKQGIKAKKKNGDIILIPNKIQLPGI